MVHFKLDENADPRWREPLVEAGYAVSTVTEESLQGAREFRRIYNPPVPDVKAVRRKLGLSQAAFARRFGFSVRTVQQWEQGRAIPDRPARLLLKVIERAHRTVEQALAS